SPYGSVCSSRPPTRQTRTQRSRAGRPPARCSSSPETAPPAVRGRGTHGQALPAERALPVRTRLSAGSELGAGTQFSVGSERLAGTQLSAGSERSVGSVLSVAVERSAEDGPGRLLGAGHPLASPSAPASPRCRADHSRMAPREADWTSLAYLPSTPLVNCGGSGSQLSRRRASSAS